MLLVCMPDIYSPFPTVFRHSTTKSWRNDHEMSVAKRCNLILIDEAHFLNEASRGATLEAAVSRMQTIHEGSSELLRFVAISATIPNIEDLATWLSAGSEEPAAQHEFGEEYRPVKLEVAVEAYSEMKNSWVLDSFLNSKVGDVMAKHNRAFKPTLIFSATRKGCKDAALGFLKSAHSRKLIKDPQHQQHLRSIASTISDQTVSQLVTKGVGIHHAGLEPQLRRTIENAFKSGKLLLLCATSTLALGVNLPAYMVIVKNTQKYDKGQTIEYHEHQVLQLRHHF